MTWTKEPPKEEGYYWSRRGGDVDLFFIDEDGETWAAGSEVGLHISERSFIGAEWWSEPVQAPLA